MNKIIINGLEIVGCHTGISMPEGTPIDMSNVKISDTQHAIVINERRIVIDPGALGLLPTTPPEAITEILQQLNSMQHEPIARRQDVVQRSDAFGYMKNGIVLAELTSSLIGLAESIFK
ncbi:TPA: hypothetical protein ACSTJY_003315 [Serratia fonticola]